MFSIKNSIDPVYQWSSGIPQQQVESPPCVGEGWQWWWWLGGNNCAAVWFGRGPDGGDWVVTWTWTFICTMTWNPRAPEVNPLFSPFPGGWLQYCSLLFALRVRSIKINVSQRCFCVTPSALHVIGWTWAGNQYHQARLAYFAFISVEVSHGGHLCLSQHGCLLHKFV